MEDKNQTGTDNKRIKIELSGPKRKSQRNLNFGPIFTPANSVGDKVTTTSNTDTKKNKILNGSNNGTLSAQRKALQIGIDNAASNKDYFKARELHVKLANLNKRKENSNKSKLQGKAKLNKRIENSNKSKLQGITKSNGNKKSKIAKPQGDSKLLKLNEKVQQLSVQRTNIQNEIDTAVLEKQFLKAQGLHDKLGKIDKQLTNVNKNISQETMKREKPKIKTLEELTLVKNTKTAIPEVGSVSFVESPELAETPILDVKAMHSKSQWPRCHDFGEDDAVAGSSTSTCTAPRVKVGTKLNQHSYMDQMNKKREESKTLVKLLESEVLSPNNNTKLWAEKRISKMGHLTRMDNLEQSPTTNEYMTRCEFAIGVNPQSKNLVVGFQVEPTSTNSPVTSVDHLKHVPSEMKILANLLGEHLSGLGYETYNTVEERGVWMSALVTVTQKNEIMLILNFNSSNLSKLAITNMQIGLKDFFARGEGAKCNIASLYVCEKSGHSIEDLSLLSGTYTITENILGLSHRISPRSFLYSNTKGLEVMLKQIGKILGLQKDSTLLDICCGSGSIGLSLASQVGEVIGVDIMEDAVLDARRSANKNNISNVQFLVGAAEDTISNMVKSSIYNDVVAIIDPPSKGLPTKCLKVIRNSPQIKKVMVLCSTSDPCLKNLVELTQSTSATFKGDPFIPVSMSPVDLLPHTTGAMALFMFMRVSTAELMNPTMVDLEKVYGVKAALTFPPTMSSKISPDCVKRNTIKLQAAAKLKKERNVDNGTNFTKAAVKRKSVSQVISKSISPVSEASLVQLKRPRKSFLTLVSMLSPPTSVRPLEERGSSSTNESTIKEITLESYHPSLKERQSGVISVLFGIHDIQCSTCGLRYSTDDMPMYRAHINWHLMIERKEDNAGKLHSRRWYLNTSGWIVSDETSNEDAVWTVEEPEDKNFGMDAPLDEKQLIKNLCTIGMDQFDRSSKQDNDENIEDGQWHYGQNYINVEDSVSNLERYKNHHIKKERDKVDVVNLSEMSVSSHMDNNAHQEGVGLSSIGKVQSPQNEQISDSEDDNFNADFMSVCASKVRQNWSKMPSDRKGLESFANHEECEESGKEVDSFHIKSSRPLIIDKCNQISLTKSPSTDSIMDLDIAAPSRKLMELSHNGTVSKLLEQPGRKINSVSNSHFKESCKRSEQPSPDQQSRRVNVDKIKIFNVQKPRLKKKPQSLNSLQAFHRDLDDECYDSVPKKTHTALVHDGAFHSSTYSRNVVGEDNEIENAYETDGNLGGITLSDSPMDGELGNQDNGDISGQDNEAVTADVLDMEEDVENGGDLKKVKKMQSKFCCPKCNCRFKSLVRLENHNQMIHVPIPCVIPGCNKLISRKKMERHLDTHSETREKIPCSMCDIVFNRSDNLRVHMKKFH